MNYQPVGKYESSAADNLTGHNDGETNADTVTQHSLVEISADDNVEELEKSKQRITRVDAAMHLIKGNLGPGCLNLPHAFALSGWLLGTSLFFVVAVQGIYSMVLLTYCKQLLSDRNAHTFMDVARSTLGPAGGLLVQIFLFVLQGGVCCVFLSLISTNLRAQTGMSDGVAVGVVTALLLGIVLLRFVKDLRWLSATANLFMLVAMFTAAIAGIVEVVNRPDREAAKRSTSSPEHIATFVSSTFFSFEGIGLVMPVENSFASYIDPLDEKRANQKFRLILIMAMSIVAALFLFIGISASIGFPDNHSGSVTAYLERRHSDNPWFGIVNWLVIVAIFFTFPLQLTPAIEVLDEWFGPGCRPRVCFDRAIALQDDAIVLDVQTTNAAQNESSVLDGNAVTNDSCFGKKEWMFRRWFMVLGCAVVVLVVGDLSLLVSLFGAIGQTGLALMPCVIHLTLQWKGIAPRSVVMSLVDVLTIAFCCVVMVAGSLFSVDAIIENGS